jgi:hypothetical protein
MTAGMHEKTTFTGILKIARKPRQKTGDDVV